MQQALTPSGCVEGSTGKRRWTSMLLAAMASGPSVQLAVKRLECSDRVTLVAMTNQSRQNDHIMTPTPQLYIYIALITHLSAYIHACTTI